MYCNTEILIKFQIPNLLKKKTIKYFKRYLFIYIVFILTPPFFKSATRGRFLRQGCLIRHKQPIASLGLVVLSKN